MTYTLTLAVSQVETGAYYLVTFEGQRVERRALRWLDRKGSTHAVNEDPDHPIPRWCSRLLDRLYPQCHHGLSLDLCADWWNHYPRDDYFY